MKIPSSPDGIDPRSNPYPRPLFPPYSRYVQWTTHMCRVSANRRRSPEPSAMTSLLTAPSPSPHLPTPASRTSSTTSRTLENCNEIPQRRPQGKQQQQQKQQQKQQHGGNAREDRPRPPLSTLVRYPRNLRGFFHRGGGGAMTTIAKPTTPLPSPPPRTPHHHHPSETPQGRKQRQKPLFFSTDIDYRFTRDWRQASDSGNRDRDRRGGHGFSSPISHISYPTASSPASPVPFASPAVDGEDWSPFIYFKRRSPRVKSKQRVMSTRSSDERRTKMTPRFWNSPTSPASLGRTWPGDGMFLEGAGRYNQQHQRRKTNNNNASPLELRSAADLETEVGDRRTGHRAPTGAASSRVGGGWRFGYSRTWESSLHRYCNWLLKKDGLKVCRGGGDLKVFAFELN